MLNKVKGVRRSKVNGSNKEVEMIVSDGEVMHFTYNRANYTPKFEKDFQEEMKGDDPGRALCHMMMTVLVTKLPDGTPGWDVVDVVPGDEDKPEDKQGLFVLPLTEDTLYELMSIDALGNMVKVMKDDQDPKSKTSNPTDSTFGPMD